MQYIWNNRGWDYLTYIFEGYEKKWGKFIFSVFSGYMTLKVFKCSFCSRVGQRLEEKL